MFVILCLFCYVCLFQWFLLKLSSLPTLRIDMVLKDYLDDEEERLHFLSSDGGQGAQEALPPPPPPPPPPSPNGGNGINKIPPRPSRPCPVHAAAPLPSPPSLSSMSPPAWSCAADPSSRPSSLREAVPMAPEPHKVPHTRLCDLGRCADDVFWLGKDPWSPETWQRWLQGHHFKATTDGWNFGLFLALELTGQKVWLCLFLAPEWTQTSKCLAFDLCDPRRNFIPGATPAWIEIK